MSVIYVAGPYSARSEEGVRENIDNACRAGFEILRRGHAPLIPHMNERFGTWHVNAFGEDLTQEEYLAWDVQLLAWCDGLLFLGPSPGANRERQFASERGIPVYTSVNQLPEVRQR